MHAGLTLANPSFVGDIFFNEDNKKILMSFKL